MKQAYLTALLLSITPDCLIHRGPKRPLYPTAGIYIVNILLRYFSRELRFFAKNTLIPPKTQARIRT